MSKDERMKSVQLGKATTEVAYDNCLRAFEECKQWEKRGNFLDQSGEKAEQEDGTE